MLAFENAKKGRYRSLEAEKMCTVISETMLYNVTTNAIFARDLSIEMQTWNGMQKYFRDTTECNEPAWLNSPLLAGRRELFSLALQTMWLCRQDLTDPDVKAQIRSCAHRQTLLFDSVMTFYPPAFPQAMLVRYQCRHLILLRAMQILLLKLARPDICSAHPDMQLAVEALFVAIKTQVTTRTRLMSDGLSWPFCTLLCAVNTAAQFDEARALAESFIPIMANGVQHRVAEAVRLIALKRQKLVSECQLVSTGSCDGRHSCLDVLIHPNGVLIGALT